MKVSVIGAGLGGLAISCLLASKGHNVQVFEKNDRTGGKMNEDSSSGYRFDTGPSLLTMPFVLEDLFKACSHVLSDHIDLQPLDPICKYFYPDGTIFENHENREKNLEAIRGIAPEDDQAYNEFLQYAEGLYEQTADAFIFNPLFDLSDLRSLKLLNFLGIDAFTTVSKRVDQQFQSSYLRKFFKRFTTYNGSSPYQAPATLNVIPHVELNQGGYYVSGGLYRVAEALESLAISLGVSIQFDAEVTRILTDGNTAQGIELKNDRVIYSDLVVANSDATETILRLLPETVISSRKKVKTKNIEPSCSGFVLLLGINCKYEQLIHHNIFFSRDYELEFRQIFQDKVMPDDPTIYIANTSYTDKEHAPEGGSNLFILVNAPYLSEQYSWEEKQDAYADHVIKELEKRGLEKLSAHIEYQKVITPDDFFRLYRSNKGSIYGTSSNNKLSAFLRPRNKSREVNGLYFVGGSTHPGGGIPLVVRSAFNAVELIERYENTESP